LTTLSRIGDSDSRAYLTGGRDQGRIFRKAMRHSRIVRVLRLAIPVTVGIGCLGAFAVFSLFDPWRDLERAPSVAGVVISGTKIVMQRPRLGGFTKDKRPYTVTARSATQDITTPDVLELEDIRAVLTTADQGDVEVIAHSGVYDGKSEKMALKRSIVVKSSAYVARLLEATVGVKTGHVLSERPVQVEMLQGTVNSNRLEVINSGEVLIFDNGVTMLLDSDNSNTTKAAAR
jgi:lipopolysaccharide export system protein LptC